MVYITHPDWIQAVVYLRGLIANQGCKGVCWAFAVRLCVSLLAFREHALQNESIFMLKGWLLSAQELVDRMILLYPCITNESWFKFDSYGSYCLPHGVCYFFIKEFGLCYESSYPYTDGRDEHKSLPMDNEVPRVYIEGVEFFGTYNDETKNLIEDAIKAGNTLTASIFVTKDFRGWTDGIYKCTASEDELADCDAHAVVILDVDPERSCALIINSWGDNFGMTEMKGLAEVSLDTLFDIFMPIESWIAKEPQLVPRTREHGTVEMPRSARVGYILSKRGGTPPRPVTNDIPCCICFSMHKRQPVMNSKVAGASSVYPSDVDIKFSKKLEGIMLFEDSASSIPDILISDGICSSVERHQSINDTEKEAGAFSGSISEPKFTLKNQSIDSSAVGSCVVIGTVSEETSEGESCQHIQSHGVGEDLEILEIKDDSNQNDKVLLKDSANCIQSNVLISDDSSSLVEGHKSQNDAEKVAAVDKNLNYGSMVNCAGLAMAAVVLM